MVSRKCLFHNRQRLTESRHFAGEIASRNQRDPARAFRLSLSAILLALIGTNSLPAQDWLDEEPPPRQQVLEPVVARDPLFDKDDLTHQPAIPAPRKLPAREVPRTPGLPAKSSKLPADSQTWWLILGGSLGALGLSGLILRWSQVGGPPGRRQLPESAVELLGRRVIEPRVSLHVVRCGSRVLLLGVGPDGVRTLCEMTDRVEVDLLTGACRPGSAESAANFANLFRNHATRATPTSVEPAKTPVEAAQFMTSPAEFLSSLKERPRV